MRLPRFEYFAPNTIEEVCSLVFKYKKRAKVIAGGTDLIVQMKKEEVSPQFLVNLKSIPNLNYITWGENEGLRIGALTTLHALEGSSIIREKFGIIAQAAHKMATLQVRNLASIGGNLCNAAPSADLAPPLIGLGAKAKLMSSSGARFINLEEFFIGPGETVLQAGEIVTEIQVPNLLPHTGGIYLKHCVGSVVGLAVVGVAVVMTLDSNNEICHDIKIVLGAVAPTPIRSKKAEKLVKGKKIKDVLMEDAGEIAADEASPIDDVRSSAHYRIEMVKVLVKRAARQASDLAKELT